MQTFTIPYFPFTESEKKLGRVAELGMEIEMEMEKDMTVSHANRRPRLLGGRQTDLLRILRPES